ncbi:sigma 54-interacting transcriptional regulator [Clostridium sp. SYSU_GA19001]|uniref:sigma 54-interacting transcriptional regulator n=1 Tax=Clostridium caldaquaticum TaxID=2940653 RepID=UPI0020777182|nr:sigma-54-dependent transcriptional regulator [Clostridium caldaquaticum]MCM8709848.1 sigma 54-interacting transcriptional regulator [Clostridium caldaquaticum]
MTNKDLIYKKLIELNDSNGIDAQTLASMIGMTRSNVSYELNALYKEGKVCKSSGRPVLFFIPKRKNNSYKESKLDQLKKKNICLTKAIEQMKAAILYPPKGIPSLLLGDTGVGKSMFASLMYEYSVDMGVRAENSPYIVFNCADYSNNPQLLTSQLFGVKKGAYTGAESDRIGLIEKANGGILFLDEIHRLPPEGQEILFTFLDTGTFRRIGDYEVRKSDVLIICATTEDPGSSLLKTFTRRIPMIIKIPSLKERSLEERLYLIKNFFKQESVKLNREIYVSLNTMRAFLSYDCPNNVGQLKSDVQLICAKAYSEFLTNMKSDVRINSAGLPHYIKEGLYKEKEHRVLWNKLVGEEIEYFKFTSSPESSEDIINNNGNSIYTIIDQKLKSLRSQGIADIAIENILENDIFRYFDNNISGISEDLNKKSLMSIIDKDILDCIDKVIYYLSSTLKRNFNNNMYTALALHINTLIKRVLCNKPITNPKLTKIMELYPKEFAAAFGAKEIIEKHIRHSIADDEAGFLTIFLLPEEEINNKNKEKVKVVLIAHGEATATSMADVANKLLGENYVIGINAPIDVSPLEILDKFRKLVAEDTNSAGYLLLVDMGSLTTFGNTIESEFNIPVKVIPLVSTLHVLEAARKALLGFSLDNIYKEVLQVNSYFEMNRIHMETKNNSKKVSIITACLTGEGGSVALKSFLNNNLKYDKDLFEIITLNCLDKNYFKQRLMNIQEKKEILFIVTSFFVDIDIPQYNMYDVINLKIIDELQETVDLKTTLIKMPQILKENIMNLDGEELCIDVMNTIKRFESKLEVKLKDEKLIGLVMHIALLVSKLKNGDNSVDYPKKSEFIMKYTNIYNKIKETCDLLCSKYCVDITDSEICYMMNFFLSEK